MKTCNLILLLLLPFFVGCKKWSFEHRLAGKYVGQWEGQKDEHGTILAISAPGEVLVSDYHKRTFTATSDQFLYERSFTFTYSKADVFMTSSTNSRVYNLEQKMIFSPKEDSLKVEIYYWFNGSVTNKTFKGKKVGK